jgi:hypothetical protein
MAETPIAGTLERRPSPKLLPLWFRTFSFCIKDDWETKRTDDRIKQKFPILQFLLLFCWRRDLRNAGMLLSVYLWLFLRFEAVQWMSCLFLIRNEYWFFDSKRIWLSSLDWIPCSVNRNKCNGDKMKRKYLMFWSICENLTHVFPKFGPCYFPTQNDLCFFLVWST